MTDWHRKLAFQQLVLAKSLSVGQAAERYGCTTRTVRYWCRNAPISCKIAGGTQRISDPLVFMQPAGIRSFGILFSTGAFLKSSLLHLISTACPKRWRIMSQKVAILEIPQRTVSCRS